MTSARKQTFTQTQVSRAARGAIKAGLAVERIEIDPTGKIVVICVSDAPPAAERPEDFAARLREAKGWGG